MSYYFSKVKKGAAFDDVVNEVTNHLQQEGFGILTEIDVKEVLKKKLDVNFRKYKILGACNPPFAYEALQFEDKVGTMLPCNVVVQEISEGTIEIAAIDPAASMQAIKNTRLTEVATEIRNKLQRVIENI